MSVKNPEGVDCHGGISCSKEKLQSQLLLYLFDPFCVQFRVFVVLCTNPFFEFAKR